MAGKGGSGSEGVMGEETAMEWTVGAFIFSGLIQREFDLSVQAAFLDAARGETRGNALGPLNAGGLGSSSIDLVEIAAELQPGPRGL
jgi:hypothetical protein